MCARICGAQATRASAGEWTVADVDSLPRDLFGRTVRSGRDLIVHTAATIGPDPRDPAKRYSGDGLECESCYRGPEEAAQRRRYQFPPLWGPDSYSDDAGMARPITAPSFINMPKGAEYDHPVLSARDAFDVAVFVDSQQRPHREGNERDFPDRALKPADATYPPFLGPFPPTQHLTGPWQPIQQWQKHNAKSLRSGSALPGG